MPVSIFLPWEKYVPGFFSQMDLFIIHYVCIPPLKWLIKMVSVFFLANIVINTSVSEALIECVLVYILVFTPLHCHIAGYYRNYQ